MNACLPVGEFGRKRDRAEKHKMPVIEVASSEQYIELIDDGGDQVVVVDFFATWCGPCKMIAPRYEELSEEFSEATFLKVDVDKVKDVAAAAGVSAMPTFQLFKNGLKVDELKGADANALRELIEKNYVAPIPELPLPVRKMRGLLHRAGVNHRHCIEKHELEDLCVEHGLAVRPDSAK